MTDDRKITQKCFSHRIFHDRKITENALFSRREDTTGKKHEFAFISRRAKNVILYSLLCFATLTPPHPSRAVAKRAARRCGARFDFLPSDIKNFQTVQRVPA